MTIEISERILFTRQVTNLALRINRDRLGAGARQRFVEIGILTYEPHVTQVTVTCDDAGLVERVTCDHPRLGTLEIEIAPEPEPMAA